MNNFYVRILLLLFVPLFLSLPQIFAGADVCSKKIGIEGMPGAGKTESLSYLAEHLSSFSILLPEINLEKDSNQMDSKDIWLVYHNLWKERFKVIEQFSAYGTNFLFDRTYFSNLAFTYASGDLFNYNIQKEMISHDFKPENLNLIIVLDVSPSVGLNRRAANKDFPEFPWNDLKFLTRLRYFYRRILPELYSGKTIFIDTDYMSLKTVKEKVMKLVGDIIPLNRNNVFSIKKQDITILMNFARQKKLGRAYTKPLIVLGYPTIYFRQQALQLDKSRKPVYLNNKRLLSITDSLIKGEKKDD